MSVTMDDSIKRWTAEALQVDPTAGARHGESQANFIRQSAANTT